MKTKERIIREAAGMFLSEGDDPIEGYNVLNNVQSNGKGDEQASDYVTVWFPFENDTVDYVLEQIDNTISQLSNFADSVVPEFIQKMDWSLLKNQKDDLLTVMENLETEANKAGKDGFPDMMDEQLRQVNSLQGIINLIDNVQDYAVDTLGKDENEVFNLTDED